MALEQYSVCKTCFNVSRHKKEPNRVMKQTEGCCSVCKFKWESCVVARSMTDKMWYEIRPRPAKSENVLCTAMMKSNNCNKGPKCLKPHNPLEKELWGSDQKAAAMEEREINKQMFQCRVCNSTFIAKHQHDQHFASQGHLRRTEEYRLPPHVGSSLTFRFPLTKRPTLPIRVPHYSLCKYSHNKCLSKNCQYAHSNEELRAWEEALAIERGTSTNGEDWDSNSDFKAEAIKRRKKSDRVHSLSSMDGEFGRDGKERILGTNNRFNLLDPDEEFLASKLSAKSERRKYKSESRSQMSRIELEAEERSKSESQLENNQNPNFVEEEPNRHNVLPDREDEIFHGQDNAYNGDDQRCDDGFGRPHNDFQRNSRWERKDNRPQPRGYRQNQREEGRHQLPNRENTLPPFMIQLKGVIKTNGINRYLSNPPNHIRLYERNNKPLDVEVEVGSDQIKWIFRLSSNQPDKLHAVMLFEHKRSFRIGQLNRGLVNQNSPQLISCPYYSYKTGCHVDREFDGESFIDITLLFNPKFGTYRTYLILHLQHSTLVAKEIKVHVGEKKYVEMGKEFEREIQMTATTIPETSPQDTIIWEESYEIFPFLFKLSNPRQENYIISSEIENHVKRGTYENIRDVIDLNVYRLRFHNLLYLEEYEHRRKLLRYNLVDYEITSKTVFNTITIDDPTIKEPFRVSQPGWKYVIFNLKYHMFEGYRTFRPPSLAYVIPKGTCVAFECTLAHSTYDKAHFMISDHAVTACEKSEGIALVRFGPDRKEYEKMHASLDELDVSLLFQNHKCTDFKYNKEISLANRFDLSELQMRAVYSIADVQLRRVPTLISGPFGCGKTETLISAAKYLISAYTDVRILIVTRNNSCANIYIEKLQENCHPMSLLSSNEDRKPILFRFMPTDVEVFFDVKTRTLLQNFVKIDSHSYQLPTPQEFVKCNVIVTTSIASFELHELRSKVQRQMFSHIFIDESAQIIEPESCIPLVLADAETKLVFAGDIRQTRPLILSEFGRKFHLDKTLFERLYKLTKPESIQDSVCKFELLDNFRCPKLVVSFLSNMFYDGKLRANPPTIKGPSEFPALSFVNVTGEELRAAGSSSYFNKAEAEQVINQIKLFMREGIDSKQITVLSTYGAQIHLLRQYCQQVLRMFITVSNLEGVQGREYDVVIISTVRTVSKLDSELTLGERVDLGLLDDVTQLNTILSRVRGWVMVVGSRDTLSNIGACSEVWKRYIDTCMELRSFYEDCNVAGDLDEDSGPVFEEERNLIVEQSPPHSQACRPIPIVQPNPPVNPQINLQQNFPRNPPTLQSFLLGKYNLLRELNEKCYQEQSFYHPRTEMAQLARQQIHLLEEFEYTLQCQNLHANSPNNAQYY
eukprot:TRINITY_DN6949_c0_g1_i1.p1 TRINITY_DN6949_c0_g1~~TRINITY_DN6949_c0_g1_i1.p1  ORF type:complete len:1367 (+),score=225.16 TRINITY_DN6949_c0_g1_i1:38-4138(+)